MSSTETGPTKEEVLLGMEMTVVVVAVVEVEVVERVDSS